MVKKIVFSIITVFLVSNLLSQTMKMDEHILWAIKRVGSPIVSADNKTVFYTKRIYNTSENKGQTQIYSVPINGGKETQLTNLKGSIGSVSLRPDGDRLAYVYKKQFWEMELDGSNHYEVGGFEFSPANLKYSPDGENVLFSFTKKIDSTTREEYKNLTKSNVKIIDDLMYRHWDTWKDGSYSHPAFSKIELTKTGKTFVDLLGNDRFDVPMKPFGGAEDLIWSPDGSSIVYQCKKEVGKEYALSTNSDLYQYDLASKTTKNLTEGNMGYDAHPAFNPSGVLLAWQGMKRDGYESDKSDIIILDLKSGIKTNLTENWDETVVSFIWSSDGKKIFFLAIQNAERHIYEITLPKVLAPINPSNIRKITSGQFNYTSMAQAGKYIIAGRQDMNHATELYKVEIKSGIATQLTHANDDIYEQVKSSRVEKRMVKTTDGKEMLTWVIYPPDFDKTKKYPTLLYCQGGPQSAVSQFYSFRWNFQLMAAKGYIIVAPNRRGLPGFGTQWNEAISKDWGGQAMQDYLSAIDAVAKEPFVDNERLGAIGASYGGYSVYMLAGIHEGRFKSFISHCGLFNLESWYGVTEELFFANFDIGGPYWLKPQPKSYEMFSPHKFAQNWDTPILVIHGGKDFRVPENQGMEAFSVAQLKGIKSRLLYFPEESHWVLSPQNGLIWHGEFFKWLEETL